MSADSYPSAQVLSTPAVPPIPSLLTNAHSGRSLTLLWLITRTSIVTFVVWIENVGGDVNYYGRSLATMFNGGGVRETLQEYPLPVVGLMIPLFAAGFFNVAAFTVIFALCMFAVDAILTRAFWLASGRYRSAAVTFWLWFVPAIGPMAYFRFDLLPAALAAGVVLNALRRPGLAGVFTGLGALLKLWPAIMLPILLVRRTGQRAAIAGFTVVFCAVSLVCLAMAGYGRLLSPLSWQSARGLQIESVPAVPLVLLRGLHPHGIWHVQPSKFKSAEIFGAAVPEFLTLTTVLTVATIVFLGVLVVRARTMPEVSAQTMGWLLLAAAMLITVTNKTLSPQYLVWLGAPLAAVLILRDKAGESGAIALKAAHWLIATALITQMIYPLMYANLMNIGTFTFMTTCLLAVRNVMLSYVAWLVCREAWRHTSHSPTALQASHDELAAELAEPRAGGRSDQ